MSGQMDTIAAIATSPGKGGIGVVRISGKKSLNIAKEICGKKIRPRHAHFSIFRDSQKRAIDQGIVLFFNAPQSFTGEDVVELQGHGGQVVLNLLLKEVLKHGARLARPGEFTERAYLNEKIDLVQAEAVADLIESGSEQAARSAIRSLEGEFSDNINIIVKELVLIRVFVEGALDFPEEEIDFLKEPNTIARLESIINKLDDLLKNSRRGVKLREGLRVVIIGRPNVGKSSLLNRLASFSKAIVSEKAGTTRDVIEETILINGVTIDVADTAGLREAKDDIEAEGVQRALKEIKKAEVVIFVTDKCELDQEDKRWLYSKKIQTERLLILHNKIDLTGQEHGQNNQEGIDHIYASMKTGKGIDHLRETLGQVCGASQYNENLVMARERHIQSLMVAKELISSGMTKFRSTSEGEILAEELKKAQDALGQITGLFHTEDLLGEIFSRFCIGK